MEQSLPEEEVASFSSLQTLLSPPMGRTSMESGGGAETR